MADRIMCDPHDKKGKPVYGMRITVDVKVEHNDEPAEEISGSYDLCEVDARTLLAAVEYMRQMNLAAKVDAPPPAPRAQPAEPAREPEDEQPDTWRCGLCLNLVPTKTRAMHARGNHERQAHTITWQPQFDVSGWEPCSCGYLVKNGVGLKIHRRQTGCPDPDAPHPIQEEELKNETGRAMFRAVNHNK